MTSNDVTLPADKTIVGLAVRTRPEQAGQDISALWQRFMHEGVAGKMSPISSFVYCIYCDYETDHHGVYTTVLGCEVAPDAEVPAGMRRVRIPTGAYTRFPVKGEPGKAVWQAWAHINGVWTSSHARRYLVDFECYTSLSPTHLEGDIWVGPVASFSSQ